MSPRDHDHPVSVPGVAAARAGVLSEGDARLAGLLGLLADPVRSRVLFALVAAGELCVGDLALVLEVTEDQVSYAVKMLRLARAGQLPQGRPGRLLPAERPLPASAAGALPARAADDRRAGGRRCARLTRSATRWPWPAR